MNAPHLPVAGRLELDQPAPSVAGPDPLDRIEAAYDLADWWLS